MFQEPQNRHINRTNNAVIQTIIKKKEKENEIVFIVSIISRSTIRIFTK